MPKTSDPNHPTRLAILAACRNNPRITLDELVELIGKSQTTVWYHVRNLQREGLIQRENRVGQQVHPRKSKNAYSAPKQDGRKARALTNANPSRRGPKKVRKVIKRDTKDALQARIDAVVAAAQDKEQAEASGVDVVRSNGRRAHSMRVRASRLG